jgi:hypothetical protein
MDTGNAKNMADAITRQKPNGGFPTSYCHGFLLIVIIVFTAISGANFDLFYSLKMPLTRLRVDFVMRK